MSKTDYIEGINKLLYRLGEQHLRRIYIIVNVMKQGMNSIREDKEIA